MVRPCGLGHLASAITRYPIVSPSQITHTVSLIKQHNVDHPTRPHRQSTHFSQHQFNKDPFSQFGNSPSRRNNPKHFQSHTTRTHFHGVALGSAPIRSQQFALCTPESPSGSTGCSTRSTQDHWQTMLPPGEHNSEEVPFHLNRVKEHVNSLHPTSKL